MTDKLASRLTYINAQGKPQCVSCKAIAGVPSEFIGTLNALCADMELALECLEQFGGIPVPVAKAILRNMEPAYAAIDICVRMAGSQKGLVH